MARTLGIIGAGHMGTLHARNLMADARVHIVGVTDVVPDRAEALARLCQGRTFPSVEALLEAGVEAVYVCTPNALHTEAVLAALQRDVHVFSEKPMATTLREARQILEATRTSRACYQVGHNRRFAPVYTFAKQHILAGFVPTSANIKMNRGELKNPPWVADTRITGGFLYESTAHSTTASASGCRCEESRCPSPLSTSPRLPQRAPARRRTGLKAIAVHECHEVALCKIRYGTVVRAGACP